jgi:hypothetical protein
MILYAPVEALNVTNRGRLVESAEICFVRVVLYGAEGRRSAGGKEE